VASIRNIIETVFTTKGARSAAAATDNVTKSQTRLGQTSASAGRQFSAQSQGLGGLVSAYAGAAATTFAVTAAFTALQKAAQFDQIIQGTNTFSSAFGSSADQVISDIKRITRGQLSIVEAAQASNLALSAGFNVDQLTSLTDVATKASRALGRDLQDSFNRVVRGSAKLEPELLDELGIFTRIEPAVEKYAASLNKSASSLTNYERRQAFVNAVIDEGQRKFSVIDTSSETAAQAFSKLSATIVDTALQVGSVIAEVLAPLANYISGNLSATFGAFGVLSTLVFSKFNQVSREALTDATTRITEFSTKLSAGLGSDSQKLAKNLSAVNEQAGKFNQSLGAGLGTQRAARNELIKTAEATGLNARQNAQLNSILLRSITLEKQKIASLTALTTRTAAQQKQLDSLNRSLSQNLLLQEKTNAAYAAQSKTARLASGAVAVFGKAVAFAGGLLTKLLSAFNIFTLVASVIGLIGPLLLKIFGLENVFDGLIKGAADFGKALLGLDERSQRVKKGIAGVADASFNAAIAATAGAEEIDSFLREKSFLGITWQVKIDKEQLAKDVQTSLGAAFEEANRASSNQAYNLSRKRVRTDVTPGQAGQEAFVTSIGEAISKVNDDLAKATTYQERVLLQAQINALESIKTKRREEVEIVGELNARTGISARLIYTQLENIKLEGDYLKANIGNLEIYLMTWDKIKNLTGEQRVIAESFNSINSKLAASESNRLSTLTQINNTTLSAEAISKAQGDLLSQELAITKEIETVTKNIINLKSGKERDAAIANLVSLGDNLALVKENREEFNGIANVQLVILQAQEAIRKSFSNSIAEAGKLSGIIDASGNIAKDDAAVQANKYKILLAAATAGEVINKQEAKALEKRVKEGGNLDKVEGQNLQKYRLQQTALQAIAGESLKILRALEKTTKEYEKQTRELKKQTDKIVLQLEQRRLNNAKALLSAEASLAEAKRKSAQIALETAGKELEFTQKKRDLESEIAKNRAASITGGVAAPLFTENMKRELEIKVAQEDLARLEKSRRETEIQAFKVKELELQAIENRKQLLVDQYNLDLALVENAKKQSELDINSRIAELKARIEVTDTETKNLKEQSELFIKFPNQVAKVLNTFVDNFAELLKDSNLITDEQASAAKKSSAEDLAERTKKTEEQLIATRNRFVTSSERLQAAQRAQLIALEAQKKAVGDDAQAKRDILTSGVQAKTIELNTQEAQSKQKYNDVVNASILAVEKAKSSLQILKEEAARSKDIFVITGAAFAESFGKNFESSMKALVQAINEGTLTMDNFKQGFRDFIYNILQDVQMSILQATIIDPIKEEVFGGIQDLLGISLGEPNGSETNPYYTKPANIGAGGGSDILGVSAPDGSFLNPFHVIIKNPGLPGDAAIPGGDLVDMFKGGQGALDSLKETNDTIASFEDDFANDYFKVSDATSTVTGSLGDFTSKLGEGTSGLSGFVSKLFSFAGLGGGGGGGGGGLFGGIVRGISGLFSGGAAAGSVEMLGGASVFMKSGGLVSDYGAIKRFAGGGNVMYQDRVPALLEPGEFVMKKSAVDSIGKSSMERMNASGKAPPVKVQIENSGSEKEAEQGDTQFDGEAMIVKLILKDLKSNGPIRKSMRSNL
jgi:hypothetical protein